ncbi:hypothetical protein HZA39_04465 [Candidatus Peregrinibacteria bacterium]|nr:hypothetical protein [Candidatus Peregrinibacteria bacterium]
MTPIKTTIPEAINTVKTWISNKEYGKAVQGIDEILEFEPANVEAKKLKEEAEKMKVEAKPETIKIGLEPAVAPSKLTIIDRVHRKISPIGIAIIIVVLAASGVAGYFGSKYLQTGETETELQLQGSVAEPTMEKPATEGGLSAPSEPALPESTPIEVTPVESAPVEPAPAESAPSGESAASAIESAALSGSDLKGSFIQVGQESAAPAEPALPELAPRTIETAPTAALEETAAQPELSTQPSRTPLQLLLDAFRITGSLTTENIEPTEENTATQTTIRTPETEAETPQRIKVKRR